MSVAPARDRSPWLYVPSLYFQQGLPVILVQQFSVLLYKKLGVPNAQIGLWTSLLAWPWILKMLWGPLVDLTATKRAWVLAMQALIVAALFALAGAVTADAFLPFTFAVLLGIAFLSATHDIALDGYYLLTLRKEDQAFFLGICSTFFRLAMVFCTGTLVILAGLWERSGLGVAGSWMRAVLVGAMLYGALAVHAARAMPVSERPRDSGAARAPGASYREVFRTFFTQPQAGTILMFILLYRFGESMLSKMTGLFLLDPRGAGGLGFDTIQAGTVLGTVGVVALVAGGVLGGIAISRFGLRACLWPMAILMHVPNLMYLWAARVQPGPGPMYFVVGVDQFAYGFGLAAYLVYTMRVCQRSRFPTSHYAMTTGLMALGAMFAGIASGFLQAHAGWFGFFVAVCVLTVPGMFLLTRIPLDPEPVPGGAAALEAGT